MFLFVRAGLYRVKNYGKSKTVQIWQAVPHSATFLSIQVSLQAVDIGMPQLAMHSSCEMAGAKDTAYLAALAKNFSRQSWL